ncbi:hypothetical protein LTR66_002330 [Elasticomyces elasticus]|nr:hypothetical protein LTR66_002330 [Elasticomyces elasticus]KAK5011842.1 hypothetical protein LTR28_004359 [Elasticomyces elasticus]
MASVTSGGPRALTEGLLDQTLLTERSPTLPAPCCACGDPDFAHCLPTRASSWPPDGLADDAFGPLFRAAHSNFIAELLCNRLTKVAASGHDALLDQLPPFTPTPDSSQSFFDANDVADHEGAGSFTTSLLRPQQVTTNGTKLDVADLPPFTPTPDSACSLTKLSSSARGASADDTDPSSVSCTWSPKATTAITPNAETATPFQLSAASPNPQDASP